MVGETGGLESEIDDASPADESNGRRGKDRLRRILLIMVPLVVIAAGVLYYVMSSRYETTDNAYVDAPQVTIRAKITGTIVEIAVKENQLVHKGDLLFRLQGNRYKTAVAQAEAELAQARLAVKSTRATYGQGVSELAAARDRLTYAQRELARQRSLLKEGIASQSQYDQAALAVTQARQELQTLGQQNASVLAKLSGNANLPVDQQADVQAALATLHQKKLDLDDTEVRAPQDGIVTKVNQIQVGDYVTSTQPLFMLVGQKIWIEANFKENQLTKMRAGQPAEVTVDAFPDEKLEGHVASFSPGTGNIFSVLPAENATGNWVKVVQRLPVQIALDKVPRGLPLHAGLSAEVTVDTSAASK